MGRPALWALLLLPAGLLAQPCPADCECNQPRTVFCSARRSPAVPQGLPRATANLYLFENGIRALGQESFAGLPALQLLDLSQNLIGSLPPGLFQPLGGLSNLDLSSNQLREITNQTFRGLRRLERLYLGRNQIQAVQPGAFSSLESLLELKLQDNRLQALPPLRLPTLLLLDLSRNPIAALQPGALRLPRLESLRLAGLGLARLEEGLLRGLGSLHELDVAHNRLAEVPAAVLRHLPGLTKLSLAGNSQISRLEPEDFRELRGLQELDISNLSLRLLPWDFPQAFPRLRALTAAQNPFHCVCQMSWLLGWLGAGRAELRRPEETRCHSPPKSAGRPLPHLAYADFGCPATTTSSPTGRAPSPGPPTASPAHRQATPPPSTAGPTQRGESPTPEAAGVTTPEGRPSPGARLCPANTCLNGGACRLDARHHLECLCLPGFTGPHCERAAWATPAPPPAPRIAIKQVGSTSLRLDLQSYIQSKAQLKGVRLTYWSLSGPDKRPVTLSLPDSLPEYTLRALKPNTSYHLCIGPLGGKAQAEDLCAEARTLLLSRQQHAPVTQGREAGLALLVVPAAASVLLLLAAAAAAYYCVRRQRRQRKARAAPGPCTAGPLELDGVKYRLDNGDLDGHGQKTAPVDSPDHEAPLVPPQYPSAATPRALRPSYF